MESLFADPVKISGFEIECCQHLECLLTNGIGKLFPS